ncbi:hypothetical protein ACLOJK_026431 [Asimina triloba]
MVCRPGASYRRLLSRFPRLPSPPPGAVASRRRLLLRCRRLLSPPPPSSSSRDFPSDFPSQIVLPFDLSSDLKTKSPSHIDFPFTNRFSLPNRFLQSPTAFFPIRVGYSVRPRRQGYNVFPTAIAGYSFKVGLPVKLNMEDVNCVNCRVDLDIGNNVDVVEVEDEVGVDTQGQVGVSEKVVKDEINKTDNVDVVVDLDEDLDAYEEDGYDQGEERYEDEGEEEEEQQEYEEEPPKPTKEELDYLSYRQRLKESIRRQMKKESAASADRIQDKNKKLPFDKCQGKKGPVSTTAGSRPIEREQLPVVVNQNRPKVCTRE